MTNDIYLMRISILLMWAGYFFGWYWVWKIQTVVDDIWGKVVLSIFAPLWFSLMTGVTLIVFYFLCLLTVFSFTFLLT